MFFERASKSLTANVSQIGFAEVIQSGFCECQLLAFLGIFGSKTVDEAGSLRYPTGECNSEVLIEPQQILTCH